MTTWSIGKYHFADNLSKAGWTAAVSQPRIKGRFIVRADEKRTAFLELLHVLLSAQIKIGHATVWMRTRICVSFILRPSLLPFGFAPWFARILRETFTSCIDPMQKHLTHHLKPWGTAATV